MIMPYSKRLTVAAISGLGVMLAGVVLAAVAGPLYPIEDDARPNWNVVPRTSATHYETIDEESCNGTSDYVYSVDPASQETYKIDISGIPVGAQITQISIVPCAGRHDADTTASSLRLYYRWNGTDSGYGQSYTLTDPTPQVMATTTFDDVLNHQSSSDELQIGVNHESGFSGVRVSNLKTIILYDY